MFLGRLVSENVSNTAAAITITITPTITAAAWQLLSWRKSWGLTSVDHAIQAPNTPAPPASQEIGLRAPAVGNPMPFLLGNLFCALHRKSEKGCSGLRVEESDGCITAQADRTNQLRPASGGWPQKEKEKKWKSQKSEEESTWIHFQGEEHSSHLLLQPNNNRPGKNLRKQQTNKVTRKIFQAKFCRNNNDNKQRKSKQKYFRQLQNLQCVSPRPQLCTAACSWTVNRQPW